MSQEDMILQHLRSGRTITPLEALRLYNCLRLGARIYDLRRKGYPIHEELVDGNGKHYAQYSMGGGKA